MATPRRIFLDKPADMHVHLRNGDLMKLVTPTVKQGGVSIAYVMPNLTPPVDSLEVVKKYAADLQALAPDTTFMMTYYLNKNLTPELIEQSKGVISGVKCYPAGVTTNSAGSGVDPNDFSPFYPVFEAMEKNGIVLNIHGECPGNHSHDGDAINVLNAEPKFLPILLKLHQDFPKLKMVFEHCTTAEAINTINKLNENWKQGDEVYVAASITAHHLYLTIDNWAGNSSNFCKPVAKFESDRQALIEAAVSGKPWFFFGSDSAPHPVKNKKKAIGASAGVFTQSHALAYVAEIFDKEGKLDKLKAFVTDNGRAFYGVKEENIVGKQTVTLVEAESVIPELIGEGDEGVMPFRAGQKVNWSVEWD